jgi:hypothetical protein
MGLRPVVGKSNLIGRAFGALFRAAALLAEAQAEVSVVRVSSPAQSMAPLGVAMIALVTWPGSLPDLDPVWKIVLFLSTHRPTSEAATTRYHKLRL